MAETGKWILCPYCGHTQRQTDLGQCVECRGYFEPLSRRSTQIAMGPWFIRDKKVPFRPGCSYDVLVAQARAGRIKPNSVIRGPTTRQFWSLARNAPGVAHLVGYCHRCGAHVSPDARHCPSCAEPFLEVKDRNELGLLYPTAREADAAQRALQRELQGLDVDGPGGSMAGGSLGKESDAAASTPDTVGGMTAKGDLLEEVLGPLPEDTPLSREPDAGRSPILDFKRRQPPIRTQSESQGPDAGSIRTPQTFDFSPAEPDGPDTDTAPLPAAGQGMGTWILLAINILGVIAVVLVIIFYMGAQDEEPPTQSPGQQNAPTIPDRTNSPGTLRPSPDRAPVDEQLASAAPHQPSARPTPTAGPPTRPEAPTTIDPTPLPPPRSPDPLPPNPVTTPSPFAPAPEVGRPSAFDRGLISPDDPLARAVRRAESLARQGRNVEAADQWMEVLFATNNPRLSDFANQEVQRLSQLERDDEPTTPRLFESDRR